MESTFDHRLMASEHPQVFILDLAERPAFAFEADNLEVAQRLVRSEWLLQALDRFFSTRSPALDNRGRLRLRKATRDEAMLYRARAEEFSDVTPHFLIAHLVSL
jgi:hypothetical protein